MAEISPFCSNDEYEHAMRESLNQAYGEGVEAVICGDLFLEDVRRYREERLLRPGSGVFPLWGRHTGELAREFQGLGFRATLCCVDTQALDGSFAGRPYDAALLADLPKDVDPCGENGEFHTFVHDGPLFANPVAVRVGERVLRDGRFMYCDLQAEENGESQGL
jgi:diphthamide synthase (EF-2-diphthine--ammonia ligase)